MIHTSRVAALLYVALLAAGLGGCAATASYLRVPDAIDVSSLPPYNFVTDDKTKTILCPKCFQSTIRPIYTRDPGTGECLTWTCSNCMAVWRTKVASPGVRTTP